MQSIKSVFIVVLEIYVLVLLSAIRSEHSDWYEDRKFYIDICTLTPCVFGEPCYGLTGGFTTTSPTTTTEKTTTKSTTSTTTSTTTSIDPASKI